MLPTGSTVARLDSLPEQPHEFPKLFRGGEFFKSLLDERCVLDARQSRVEPVARQQFLVLERLGNAAILLAVRCASQHAVLRRLAYASASTTRMSA